MIIAVVCLDQARLPNYQAIIDAYSDQTVAVDAIVFVLDRCEAPKFKSSAFQQHFIASGIAKPNYFGAGICRDVGLSKALSLGATVVIFTDGDCVPTSGVVEAFSTALESHDMAFGLRRFFDKDGGAELGFKDSRDSVFTESVESDVIDIPAITAKGTICVSCSMAMNAECAKRLIEINNAFVHKLAIVGKDLLLKDRVFCSSFDGAWGGEDTMLGYVAQVNKLKLCLIPRSAYVKHLEHLPSTCDSGPFYLRIRRTIELYDEVMNVN